jgi:hypothetical protein
MNVYLRDKLLQKLETLSDERGYQILDYVEFLDSRYADRTQAPAAGAGNPLSRFADAVEEKLRAGRVSASTIAETMGLMNRAVGVLSGAAAAGKSVANDLMSATSRVVDAATSATSAPRAADASGPSGGSGPAATGQPNPSGTSGATGGSAPTPGTGPAGSTPR